MSQVTIKPKKKNKLKSFIRKLGRFFKRLIIFSIILGIGWYIWGKLAPIFLGEGQTAGLLDTVKMRQVESKIVTYCEIKPRIFKEYRFNGTGKLKKLYAKVGKTIDMDATIAIVESSEIEDTYNEAVNELKKLEEDYGKVKNEYSNTVLLYKKELASQQQVIQARDSLRSFETSKLKQAKNEVKEAKVAKEALTIKSDFFGHVVEQEHYEGDILIKNTLIVTVAKMDDLYARFYISKGHRDKLRKDLEVILYKKAAREGDAPIGKGNILLISSFVEKKGIMTELSFNTLKKGEETKYVNDTLRCEIIVNKTPKKVPSIPLSAIYVDKDNYYVYIVEKGITKRRNIKLGLIGYSYAELLSGINTGEQFVSGADEYVVEGMAFKQKR